MTRSSSVSPQARASSVCRALLSAAVLACASAAAQPVGAQGAPVVVVDLDRAVRESAAAADLREREVAARRALQTEFDAVTAALELREGEMVELRRNMEPEAFDVLVKEFDARVRDARRGAQEQGAALQARFGAAQSALLERIRPIVGALMRERGAVAVLERKAVVVAEQSLDVTDALILAMNEAHPNAADLLPEAPRR